MQTFLFGFAGTVRPATSLFGRKKERRTEGAAPGRLQRTNRSLQLHTRRPFHCWNSTNTLRLRTLMGA